MERILLQNKDRIKLVHFTGSSKIAQKIMKFMDGKCRYEDSGFNWKVIGPDLFSSDQIKMIAQQCDQDAYAASGQKCSAQRVLLIH